MSDKQGLPKLHTTEKGVPVYDAGSSRKANQLAREWAQVPRAGRGGEYIPSRELNDPGPNRTRITAAQQQHGRPDQLGMRMAMDRQGKIAPNQYAHHPDLHSAKSGDPPHHEFPHYHATNAKGEKVIYVYRNGGGGGGGGRGGSALSAIASGVMSSRAGEKGHAQASGPGGIKFTTELDINSEQQLGKLVGLVDPESGLLSLLTSAPQAGKVQYTLAGDLLGITMSDLALALLLPQKVYIPERLRSTTFGEIMFEADWKLKLLAFGSLSSSSVRSEADITFAQPEGAAEHRYSRLWIENARVLVIKDVQMVVLAKRQVPDAASPSGLRDVDEHDPTSSERICAEEFTRRYDEVAAQYTCFQRLTELSKALSLAKFILTQTAIDLDWELIEQVASGCITQVSPNTVPSHRQSHSRTFTTGNASFKRTLNLVCLLHALTHTHTPTHHRTRTPLDCLG
ncbi:uncharacterized protein ACA1_118720 [Acanthamoeba castellanii str. Neff]|uniref:Uncharacterized protein n=1 Tax=Acanthamoeba castellanii (strain ATCC 30010 / Neff) TaxID=1257118 RepID=L8GKC6_ACACF|nr:uncharacterized protein ACA1_118720 [Acanthamoeba castellanii str. Neff]ELR13168.1 hypothetical protein ACA1_118720 [Acanthamoeba castellanii str. Neff]